MDAFWQKVTLFYGVFWFRSRYYLQLVKRKRAIMEKKEKKEENGKRKRKMEMKSPLLGSFLVPFLAFQCFS